MSDMSEERLDHFATAVLLDALMNGTAKFWERRADAFGAAAHKPEDYPGRASAEQLRDQVSRCMEIAEACRARALVELWERRADAFEQAARQAASYAAWRRGVTQ
jgi:uncharacterized SAM-dependent methyltransferase